MALTAHRPTAASTLALLALLALASAGCAIEMAYLPTDETATYPSTDRVEVFWHPPERPYEVIGRVSASSGDYGEEELFRRVKVRAAQEGAHAIIVGATEEGQSVVGIPQAKGGTLIIPTSSYRVEALAIRWLEP